MKNIALIVLWLLAVLGLPAQPLKVGAYNLRNYLSTDRMVEGVFQRNYPKPEAEKNAVFAVIKEADVDVLAVSELGGEEYFEEFKARLKAHGLLYPYSAHMRAGDTQRHLAIFSKVPFTPVFHNRVMFGYQGKKTRTLRGMLEAQIAADGDSLSVFALHLKSRISDDAKDPLASDFREREASALRDIIDERVDAGTLKKYIILGDFNDAPRSKPLRRFLKKGEQTLAVMLEPIDSRGEKWTHYWEAEGSYSRIDYILISPSLASRVEPSSVRIIDIPESKIGSDHRMVAASVDWKESVNQ